MQTLVGLAKRLASRLLGTDISVRIAMEPTWPFGATYGPGHLVFNAGRLGRKWFGGPLADILDLLLHEREEIRTAELTVPHPHLWYRRFALDPLAELAGEVVHPERGITIAALRERLLDRPMRCGIYGGESERREEIVRVLCLEFPGVEMRAWGRGASGPDSEALSLWLGPRTDLEKETGEFEELPRVSRFDVRTIPLFATDAIRQMLVAACGE